MTLKKAPAGAFFVPGPDDASKFQAQAKAAGDHVELLVPTPAGHVDMIALGSNVRPTVEAFLVNTMMALKPAKC